MFDVFYFGSKPNLFAHEQPARDIEHARELSCTRYFWWVNYLTDYTGWDFLWEPVPWEADQRHAWPSQWQSDSGTYLVPKIGYADTNYRIDKTLKRLPCQDNWYVPDYIDETGVNFSWHPNPIDTAYIYHFPSQWQSASGLTYTAPNATEIKLVDDFVCRAIPTDKNWHIPKWIKESSVDRSWHPDVLSPPCNYMFETKWHWDRIGGPEYRMPGAVDIEYVHAFLADTQCERDLWHIPEWIDPGSIDYTWVPNPTEPPYIYEFPVEWGWNNVGGPEYRVPGATDKKYATEFQACTRPDPSNFVVSDNLAKDDPVFRWRPNPTEVPYIYVFGNQWWPAEVRESARYTVAGATQIKYVDDVRSTRLPDVARFIKLYNCDFDHSWEPDPGSPPYVYVFGNQYYSAEVMPTVEYHMPDATERKYMDMPAQLLPDLLAPWKILHESDWDYTWCPEPGSPPYIYVFGNQWWPAEKMPTVEYHMPGATERKYMPGPVGNLPTNMNLWHIPKEVDVRDMDFSWVPDPGEPPYIYQFATQHQKTGGPQYCVPGATEVKYLDMMRAEISTEAVPVFEIDHMDGNAGQIPNTVRRVRYFDNYRDTLIRLARSLKGKHEHVWVCSSVCDYSDFDFSWHPETWQSTMLHVFASDGEKFGDTFYMHVPTFAERAEKKELLEWYSVNYVPRRTVPRRPLPIIQHNMDTHVEAVKTTEWLGPLAVFATDTVVKVPPVSLWREKTKTVMPLSTGASQVIVPKVAVPYIKTQLYDYPHIDKTQRHLHKEQPLDIVFIDNGEPNAEYNWLQLPHTTITNQIHRSSGVNGRVSAYHSAARLSTTSWFFAVFAKLQVAKTFDWSWQPDRMQEAKHYIFHAFNPINGLTYGHQAMIAYNRELVLSNPGAGLDFTLDSAHEVVPILSGTAEYAQTPWMAWRTAFRECVKLRGSADVESRYRLDKWLTVAMEQPNGQYSIYGAEDAVEFYESVSGDLTELRNSYDWAWLATYALVKRNLIAD
jgi:hypothetical protein